jgi:phage baseplate assembly protein W
MGVPHLRIPFHVGAGGAAETVEQDSLDEIAQCVVVLVSTERGERFDVPTYGIPDETFTPASPDHAAAIEAAVGQWEPRATVLLTNTIDSFDELARRVKVNVSGGHTSIEAPSTPQAAPVIDAPPTPVHGYAGGYPGGY